MLDKFLQYLIFFDIGLAVIASLLGLMRYRLLSPSLRWLALLASFDATVELTASFINSILHLPTLFLLPISVAGEVVLLALLYRRVLESATFSRIVPWLVGLFALYALLQSPLLLDVKNHVVSLEIISDLIQIGLASIYFQKLLNELQVEKLRLDPFFWLSVALVTHGLGDILISLFSNYLLAYCTEQLQKIIFWGVRNVFNIQLYFAYILVLWARPVPANAGVARPA